MQGEGLSAPLVKFEGEWEVIDRTNDHIDPLMNERYNWYNEDGRPTIVLAKKKSIGVVFSYPFSGIKNRRHEMVEIAVFKNIGRWEIYAYFRSVNEAKEKISSWNIDTETIDYEEWVSQGLKNFLSFLTDGNILLIRPWPKKFAFREPYAGAVQFFNNFEDAKDQWGLQNFSTLNRRVEKMERLLRTRELRKKFIS